MKTQGQRFLLLIIFLTFARSYSQVKITGKVSYKNKGVGEVNVTLKDTYDGATTDANGNFSFETSEKGNHFLTFTHPNYIDVEKPISIEKQGVSVNIELKEQINEINAVVISAGSIEASDKKRATALLTPIDIYTTAGADGQISSALNFLPGVQKVGETEGLFIRGGTGTESKIFMDGSLINNYFSNSVPGIAGRDRFNTSLFKGNVFSSGGYSALYGQALSGALMLESVDLPDQSSYDFGISPIFLSAGFQRLSEDKNHSYGATLGYSMLNVMQEVFNFNTDFIEAPQGLNGDLNFRIKTKSGGFLKYYGMYDSNKMGVKTESLEPEDYDFSLVRLKGKNTYHNLSFRQKFGKYLLNAGTSYSFNRSDLNFSTETADIESDKTRLLTDGNYINFKTVLERKVNKISAVRGGIELNSADEKLNFEEVKKHYKDLISSVFVETDLGFSNQLSAKIGVRAEHSSYLGKSNIAPRFALAYRLSQDWTTSFAYGLFYQNPESKYINGPASLDFQKAQHYIFQLQRASEGRSLRFEAFYKKYNQLVKFKNLEYVDNQNQYVQTADNNNGYGFAKGLEVFWRDKKTFQNIDYWISYSFLDSKRDFMNYPVSLKPNFASEHTISAVAKRFVPEWKVGINLSYTYAKGRPYYDIASQNMNGQTVNYIRHEGRLKDYNALNVSFNYLPNLGKKDAKAFTVFVLSISNVLGSKNVYGYNFSMDGTRNSAVVPPVNTFVFVGAFISFGVDKTQDAINNNL
ncbi:carboxypeptidase-like regulatory domain-containing protein [Chryseobacterium daecheongense]|uniref:TonB-dependent receptor n=1 Tax=Chryseobacterium daecheongense TaxID=192389 RepID=UPI001FD672F3|nr:carboxypeptidase-like regulatory domain-containing protein [Chryseobacterium daecheongense]UOU99324.1 carboxypeptidase-like regulatory domain-containing protein [Chryseobacterium daecheongense]